MGQFYFIEAGLRVTRPWDAELSVGLVDAVVEGGEVVGFGNLYDEALEVFGGVVGGGDGEELMADVEVEAFRAGEVGFEGARFEAEGVDSAEAVAAGANSGGSAAAGTGP